ncbi:MAG TPA: extracellular solute-binding protein, partial [Candidatus Avichristensenella intestinipullorum]|nr:extracellular solute-binding protein [Candidatus Avichristensenella intestinipullorum]
MKRLLSALLVLAMAMSASCALAIEEPLPFQGEFPFSEEPITLDVFNMQGVYTRGEFQDMECWKWLTEQTNIGFKFESYTDDIITEKLALKMTGNELPDLFFKCALDNATVLKYAQEGIFIPITDYLEEYAPHFYYQIENDPSLRAFLTMSDGEIYGFNYIISASNYMTPPVFVNGEWLRELGYEEVPEDLDALKELLIKVRDTDLNGNGEKDEVPLIATSLDKLYFLFAGAFGINTRGRTATYLDIDENGALRYIPTSEGYKNLMQWFSELYQEGLIYQEIFDSSIANMTAAGEQNRIFLAPGS